MTKRFGMTVLSAAALVAAIFLAIVGARAQSNPSVAHGQSAAPQSAPPSMAGKKAPDVFKNIQVLKDLDADQLQPSMQFIAASLGVECNFCHVQENGKFTYEKDDKPAKATARKMMQMTMDINKMSFEGHRDVTCNTCHRGAASPVGAPAVLESDVSRERPAAPQAMPPAANQLLDKYLQAAGGAEALQKISSRVEKGNLLFGQNQIPIEIFAKAPNKRISITNTPNGESMTAFDGTNGWLGNAGRPARDMDPIDARSAMVEAIFALPLDVRKFYSQFRPGAPEKIGDKEVYILYARGQRAPLTKFSFDEQSGLLVRSERYNDVGLGLMPVRVDYSDYRDADGIKIPFHWTLSRPGGRFSIQIDSVQQNVSIDDSKFAKPATPAAPGQ